MYNSTKKKNIFFVHLRRMYRYIPSHKWVSDCESFRSITRQLDLVSPTLFDHQSSGIPLRVAVTLFHRTCWILILKFFRSVMFCVQREYRIESYHPLYFFHTESTSLRRSGKLLNHAYSRRRLCSWNLRSHRVSIRMTALEVSRKKFGDRPAIHSTPDDCPVDRWWPCGVTDISVVRLLLRWAWCTTWDTRVPAATRY